MFILPKVESFGEKLGSGLGSGIGQGISQTVQQLLSQRSKQNLLKQIEGLQGGSNPQDSEDQYRQMLAQSLSGQSGRGIEGLNEGEFNERQAQQDESSIADHFWNKMQGSQQESKSKDPFLKAKKYAALGEKDLSRIASDEAKLQEKQKFARETGAEKNLLQMEDSIRSLENSAMRFERLNELSSPELDSQFPSSLMVGAFTKNGELNPVIQSQLSPDAQEYTKLIADELEGVKGMVGSRVTNYDIQAYMKRLPTLLNTPEGRRRVLRDLRLMNQLNREYFEGLTEHIDEHGGIGNKSLSKMTRDFKKNFAKRESQLRRQFVEGDKHSFSSLPDASVYSGSEIVDEETGQRFRSDGKKWNSI